MQVDHAKIPRAIKDQKRRVVLSVHHPLLLVLSPEYCFLNKLSEAVLTYYQYPYQLHSSSGKQVMEFAPPLICFEDVVLSEDSLIEFLCDIALSRQDLDQFITRKENVKRIYRAWKGIFNKEQLQGKGDLEQLTQNDPSSTIYHQLHLLARDVAHRGYQRIFPSYLEEMFNIEAMLLVDIRHTILTRFPREITDYLLRGAFPILLDVYPDYLQQHMAKREDHAIREEEPAPIFVLLDGNAAQVQVVPRVNFNIKWFFGVLAAVTLAFGKWAH